MGAVPVLGNLDPLSGGFPKLASVIGCPWFPSAVPYVPRKRSCTEDKLDGCSLKELDTGRGKGNDGGGRGNGDGATLAATGGGRGNGDGAILAATGGGSVSGPPLERLSVVEGRYGKARPTGRPVLAGIMTEYCGNCPTWRLGADG
jgi:hypothetical protein